MGVFILASPKYTPPPGLRRFPIRSQWIGFDGTIWDLHSGGQGVALLNDGLVGLHMPRFDRYTSTLRVVPGHRLRGTHARPRSVVWPLFVHGDTQLQWLSTEQGFWKTIHPEIPGTWRVGVGTQQVRELKLTGMFDDDHAYPHDPYRDGWAKYVLEMEAAQPYWEGVPITRTFKIGGAEVDFFDVGGSPPFHISAGQTFDTASINNPGDVEAYPKWTLEGPLDTISVGVGAVTVDVTVALEPGVGEVLVIDTDPRNQSATLDGVDVSATLGFQNFAAIGSGQNQPLTVVASDSGSITCELVPLYYRAI